MLFLCSAFFSWQRGVYTYVLWCHTLWWLLCLCAVFNWGIHYYFISLLPKTLAQYLLWKTDTQLLNVVQCLQKPFRGSSTESLNSGPQFHKRITPSCILILSTKMVFSFEVSTKIFYAYVIFLSNILFRVVSHWFIYGSCV